MEDFQSNLQSQCSIQNPKLEENSMMLASSLKSYKTISVAGWEETAWTGLSLNMVNFTS